MTWHPMFGYVDQGRDLTEATYYASALKRFGEASGLPSFAFCSKKFADLEDEKVWTRNWICVGYAERIPNAGDILPHTIGNHGIHIQRQNDGSLIGRFNFAQHGGCRFVPGQCQTGKKTKCSYTACGFSRDRDVMHAAEDGNPTQDMGQYLGPHVERLMPVQVREWGPFIFANVDFDATSSHRQFPALDVATSGYFAQGVRHLDRHKIEVTTNWKVPGVNFLSSYYIPGDRQRRVVPSFEIDAIINAAQRDAYWAYSVSNAGDEPGNNAPVALPELILDPGWSAFCWIYPNLLLRFFDDHFVSVILQPASLTSCLQYVDIFSVGNRSEKCSSEFSNAHSLFWREVIQQEATPLEQWQHALSAGDDTMASAMTQQSLVYAFQQHFLAQILSQHQYFINKPLYGAPGRALNAGR
jgi:hypothetical protein